MSWLRNWAIASSLTAEVLGATEYAKLFLQEKQEMPDFFRLYILIYSVSSKVPAKTEVYADEVCASWGSVGGMSRWWGGLETAEWPNLEGVVVSGAESSWRLITLSVLWKSVLDPVVFNFSFNYFDDETERALRKLAETQNWEKGDLGRPEKWADRNFVMFQRETEVLHLGRSTLLHAEGHTAGKQLLREGPGYPGRSKLTVSQKWSLEAKKDNSFLSCIQRTVPAGWGRWWFLFTQHGEAIPVHSWSPHYNIFLEVPQRCIDTDLDICGSKWLYLSRGGTRWPPVAPPSISHSVILWSLHGAYWLKSRISWKQSSATGYRHSTKNICDHCDLYSVESQPSFFQLKNESVQSVDCSISLIDSWWVLYLVLAV